MNPNRDSIPRNGRRDDDAETPTEADTQNRHFVETPKNDNRGRSFVETSTKDNQSRRFVETSTNENRGRTFAETPNNENQSRRLLEAPTTDNQGRSFLNVDDESRRFVNVEDESRRFVNVDVKSVNEGRGFVDEDNLLALLEQSRNRQSLIRQKTSSEDARRGQGRAVDIANLLTEIMNEEKENQGKKLLKY